MPICINDTTKNYNGTEPSPKGIGYSANGEEENTKMKGKDGNVWMVKSYNGKKKWVLYDERPHKLIEKLYKQWYILANGALMAVCKNGTYKIFMKSENTKLKTIWDNLNDNFTIDAIIWTKPHTSIFIRFIKSLITNLSVDEMAYALRTRDLYKFLVKDFNRFFIKHKVVGNKDYSF